MGGSRGEGEKRFPRGAASCLPPSLAAGSSAALLEPQPIPWCDPPCQQRERERVRGAIRCPSSVWYRRTSGISWADKVGRTALENTEQPQPSPHLNIFTPPSPPFAFPPSPCILPRKQHHSKHSFITTELLQSEARVSQANMERAVEFKGKQDHQITNNVRKRLVT
jgi:hypothetical protein